jgi:hypothetical protein
MSREIPRDFKHFVHLSNLPSNEEYSTWNSQHIPLFDSAVAKANPNNIEETLKFCKEYDPCSIIANSIYHWANKNDLKQLLSDLKYFRDEYVKEISDKISNLGNANKITIRNLVVLTLEEMFLKIYSGSDFLCYYDAALTAEKNDNILGSSISGRCGRKPSHPFEGGLDNSLDNARRTYEDSR